MVTAVTRDVKGKELKSAYSFFTPLLHFIAFKSYGVHKTVNLRKKEKRDGILTYIYTYTYNCIASPLMVTIKLLKKKKEKKKNRNL